VWNIRLKNGMRLRMGETHPVMVRYKRRGEKTGLQAPRIEWVETKDLTDEMEVCIPLHCPDTKRVVDVPDEALWALGLLMSDGALTHSSIMLAGTHHGTIAEYIRCLKTIGDADNYHVFETRGATGKGGGKLSHHVQVYKRGEMQKIIDRLGVGRKIANEKYLPDAVRNQLTQDQVWALLGGLWAGDGAAYTVKSGKHLVVRVVYATGNERFAHDVQWLLLRVGIPSSVVRNGKHGFQVTVVGAGKEVLLQALDDGTMVAPSIGSGTTRRGNPRATVPEMLDILRNRQKQVRWSAVGLRDTVMWVPVVSKVCEGRQPVYEIEVPGPHTFVAEGAVTHNCTATDTSKARAKKYAKDGQFSAVRIFGQQLWGHAGSRSRRTVAELNMVKNCSPWRSGWHPLQAQPLLDETLPQDIWDAEHELATLELETATGERHPLHWRRKRSEFCWTRYGDCFESEACQGFEKVV